MKNRKFVLALLTFSGAICSLSAWAADTYTGDFHQIPLQSKAVSAPNGKIAIHGGSFDDETVGLATGAFSTPIGMNYGLQFDAALGTRGGDLVGGGGLHAFWRNPTIGLLGGFGSFTQREDIGGHVARLGVEGEYYWNRMTFRTAIGIENIKSDANHAKADDGFFAFSDVSYYNIENLKLSVGHRYTNGRNAIAVGVEYQLEQDMFAGGVSLFAEGRIGEDDYKAVWGGVRLYLADEKSLMKRHREDDPTGLNEEDLFGLPISASSTTAASPIDADGEDGSEGGGGSEGEGSGDGDGDLDAGRG